MKQHSEDFKNQVAELGRQFSSKLIYDDEELVEELYSVTPHFKGNMLKSTMKQLDVETTEDIPVGTEVNYQLGLLVDDEYEWLDYGNYIVYSSEKQEDKGTYKLVCYDKLLNSMVTYDGVEGTFPMTLREYLQAICDKLDIDFGSANDEFANYDRVLPSDRYEGLEEYTYRDVLDEIAQATGSMICLNNDDELVVRYINEGIDNYNTVTGTSFSLTDADGGLSSSIYQLEGNTSQSGTPTPDALIDVNVVSGDNEVLVRGKNLCFTDVSQWEIGEYSPQDGSKIAQNARARLKILIPVNPNTAYYFNTFYSVYNFVIRGYDINQNFVISYGSIGNGNTITTGNTVKYIGVIIWKPGGDTEETGTEIINGIQNEQIKPFICLNSETNKEYEPFKGNSYSINFYDRNPRLPKEYQEVEYIAGTGVQYINTKVLPNANTRVVIDLYPTAAYKWIFGSRTSMGSRDSFAVYLGGEKQFWAQIGGSSSITGGTTTGVNVLERHLLDVSGTSFKCDGQELLRYSNVLITSTSPLYLFALITANDVDTRIAQMKLFSSKIYEGNNLIRNFVPCYRIDDNEPGLFDLINNVFYSNDGTGTFNIGDKVYIDPVSFGGIGNYRDGLKKSSGENKFNSADTIQDDYINGSGMTYSIDNGVYTLDGSNNRTYIFISYNLTLPAGTYTYSGCPSGGSTEGYSGLLQANGTNYFDFGSGVNFTLNEETTVKVYPIRVGGSKITVNNLKFYTMINKGSTALPYEPHGIHWYIERNIRHLSLKIADMNNSDAYPGWKDTPYIRSDLGVGKNTNFFADGIKYFSNFRKQTTSSPDYINLDTNSTNATLFLNKSMNGNLTQTQWKEQYSDLVIELYYTILNGPVYEVIEDETLIQQLDAIQDIVMYEGNTNIDWIGREKPDMTLKYYQGRTLEEINEEYLKDVNVDFGEKYGPVNSIVLSRSGESDNVYIQDEDSIEENGLHELKIVDNQLMNFNDRSDYLQGLLDKLGGLEYYINDFKSTGICYLELGDRYYVNIGDNTYSCVMFNDEIEITGGLKEFVYTEMPEETETDYTKADKTDRRINQTYLIVDKQNQQIQSLVSDIGDRSQKTTTITQDIDGIEELLASTVDVTRDAESTNATVSIAEVNLSEPVEIRVRPTTSPGISYLYPRTNLYPSDTLYMTERKIRFVRTYEEDNVTKTENIDYELPDNLLYYNENAYDEFILDYLNKECKIIKKCAYNANGQVVLTGSTETIQYEYPTITLPEGDYEVKILGYNVGYIYARLMIQNEYTKLFTTEVETETSIAIKEREIMANVSQEYETKGEAATQYAQIKVTTDGISSEVANKVGNDEVVSKINQSAEAVSIDANKININGVISANGNFKVDTQGNMTCNNAKMNGGNVALYGGTVNNPNLVIYDDANNTEGGRALFTSSRLRMYPKYSKDDHIEMKMQFVDNNNYGAQPYAGFDLYHGTDQATLSLTNSGGASVSMSATGSAGQVVNNGPMYATAYNNYSKESIKKNFEKINNATDILKNAEIYEYNYKNEKDSDRKHIGFVIADEGGNFKTPKEVMSKEEDAIDMYSMCSILWKAVQEQQEKIEELENKLKEEK